MGKIRRFEAVAIVTGATQGIGRSTAIRMAREAIARECARVLFADADIVSDL